MGSQKLEGSQTSFAASLDLITLSVSTLGEVCVSVYLSVVCLSATNVSFLPDLPWTPYK